MAIYRTPTDMIEDRVSGQKLSEQLAEKAKKHWIDVREFGATLDGLTNDLTSVKNAIATLQDGDVLYFPKGTCLITGEPVTISIPNITIRGNGLLKMQYGFRPTESGFTVDGVRFEATSYHTEARAIKVDTPPSGKFIRNFVIRNCSFKNFFYATYMMGGSYEVTGNEATEGFPIRDVIIENCYSETYTAQNAGHFQCIQVENVSYLNNRTYGGQNATSYNIIKGNGYVKIIGNYDDSNSYGSCEVENTSGKSIISGNTFKKAIWVDDAYSVVIDGNYTDDVIKLTVGNHNGVADNIIISNNIAKQIRAESFGTYEAGTINNLLISDNTINGSGSYGIFIDGKYVAFALVDNNLISGTYTSGKVGLVRGTNWTVSTTYTVGQMVNASGKSYKCTVAGTSGTTAPSHTSGTATDGTVIWEYMKTQCEMLLRHNIVKGTVVISGTGGLVYGENNLGAAYTGSRDTLTY